MVKISRIPSKQGYQLKIMLNHIKPPIWRRFIMDSGDKLSDLHKAIQTIMGWTNSHLHQFRIGIEIYAEPFEDDVSEGIDTRKVRIRDTINRPKQKIQYDYDFGDGWEHTIVLEKIHTGTETLPQIPYCLSGKRGCPPEDCGGPYGYSELLEILNDPRNEQYDEMQEWVGRFFDPEEFDLEYINDQLKTKDYGCFIL